MQKSIAYSYQPQHGTRYDRTTTLTYSASGVLNQAYISDDKPRTVYYTNDANGQTLERRVSYTAGDAPREVYYRFGGKEMGKAGNNGTDNPDYSSSARQRLADTGRGVFANGGSYGRSHVDFDQNYTALNSFTQGSSAGSYTVRGGESLQLIAQQVYGVKRPQSIL